MRIMLLVLVTIFSSIYSNAAYSSPMKFKVYGEKQTEEMTKCGISYQSVLYGIESAIRYNQQEVTKKGEDLHIYVNILSMPIATNDGSHIGYCATSFEISFKKYDFDHNNSLPDGKLRIVDLEYCSNGGLSFFDKNSSQNKIIESLRGYVDGCISKILYVD